jgi:dipeptidyl aminopeptidase/acylaminoacyl peptidase
MKALVALTMGLAAVLAAADVEAAAQLQDYGRLPAVEMVELSPDGAKLAYVGALKGERSIVVLQVGGEILAATPLKDQAPAGLQWAGSEILLLRTERTVTGLNRLGPIPRDLWIFEPSPVDELIAIDLKHRTSHSLTENETLDFYPGGLLPVVRQLDGRWYAFLRGAPKTTDVTRKTGSTDLYRLDLETADAVKVADAAGGDASWALGPDGSVIARAAREASSTVWTMRTTAGEKTLLRRDDGYNSLRIYGFGRDANTFVVGPVARNAAPFLLVKADGSGEEPLQDQPHVQRLWFDPGASRLIGYTAGADQMKVTFFDQRQQARMQAAYKAFAGYSTQLMSASADFNRMVVKTTGKDDPGTFWLVDMSTGKATSLGMSAPVQDLASVSMFDYTAADGLPLHGVLTLPLGASGKNLPLVVMPRGAGAQRAYPEFDWWAQAFASRGYAVFQPSPRGVMGYGQAYHDAGHGEIARKMLTDVTDGIRALSAAGTIDSGRVCLVGADLGAYSALALLTKEKLTVRCAVAFAAPSNFSKALIEDYWTDMIAKPTAVRNRSRSLDYEAISPFKFKNEVKAPLMLIHPKDDTIVSIEQSRSFADGLKRSQTPVELVELEGADHWLINPATRTATLTASVGFVEKHNPAR